MMLLLLRLLEPAPSKAHILDLNWELTENREEPVITFRVGLGSYAKHLGSATATELGLPVSIEAARRGFGASPRLTETLREGLSGTFGDSSPYPLHIHFRRRDGYLAMVHWEALLRPIWNDRRRMRRLPYYSLPSVACAPNDLALLIDPTLTELSPELHRIIGDVMSSFSISNGNTSHVFASQALAFRLQRLNDIKPPTNLYAFDSPQTQPNAPQPSHDKPVAIVDHPFLRWVLERLKPSPVNSVVFVCQGRIELNEGVVTLPVDGNSDLDALLFSKSIPSDEMNTFLMQLGALACAFIDSTPSEVSGAGLRLLADKLAQSRPGLAVAFEPDEGQALHDFFFNVGLWPPWVVFPSSGAYLSNEFPWLELAGDRIIDALERFTLLRDLVSEYRWLKDSPRGDITHIWRLPKEPVPRWVVAVQRHLEMLAAQLLESSEDDSVSLGMEDGVMNLRDTVRRYLQASEGGATS